MLTGSKPRVFSFLSVAVEEKGAMFVNLAASLTQAGSDVVVLDACAGTNGIAGRLGADQGPSLLQVANQECAVEEAVRRVPQGFFIATLLRGVQHPASDDAQQLQTLSKAFDAMAARADIVIVDTELEDSFSLPALASGEIVVQVSTTPESITAAYSVIKQLYGRLGRRPFSVLVTGASDKEAQVVYQNMAQAANRYLAVKLNMLGSVPADEHLTRAARLGRSVIDAFPLAGASVAFRRLAGKFALPEVAASGVHGMSANGT